MEDIKQLTDIRNEILFGVDNRDFLFIKMQVNKLDTLIHKLSENSPAPDVSDSVCIKGFEAKSHYCIECEKEDECTVFEINHYEQLLDFVKRLAKAQEPVPLPGFMIEARKLIKLK